MRSTLRQNCLRERSARYSARFVIEKDLGVYFLYDPSPILSYRNRSDCRRPSAGNCSAFASQLGPVVAANIVSSAQSASHDTDSAWHFLVDRNLAGRLKTSWNHPRGLTGPKNGYGKQCRKPVKKDQSLRPDSSATPSPPSFRQFPTAALHQEQSVRPTAALSSLAFTLRHDPGANKIPVPQAWLEFDVKKRKRAGNEAPVVRDRTNYLRS
jgi:hypothetical protein